MRFSPSSIDDNDSWFDASLDITEKEEAVHGQMRDIDIQCEFENPPIIRLSTDNSTQTEMENVQSFDAEIQTEMTTTQSSHIETQTEVKNVQSTQTATETVQSSNVETQTLG